MGLEAGTSIVRRVVTGTDEAGLSYVASDGTSPNRHESPTVTGFGAAQIWYEKSPDVSNTGYEDNAAADADIPMHPALGATIFRVADFPPDASYSEEGRNALFGEIGGDEARAGASASSEKHFWFHKTDSIDYAIVLEGEIWLLLDNDEVLLRQGDTVVQRGTAHSWANRSDKPCRMAFVLFGADPVPAPSELAGRS